MVENYKLKAMNKSMIFKQLMLVLVTAALSFCGKVSAQNGDYPTDTIYHSMFGCDSVLLPANNTVYYHDTTVSIPHKLPVDGVIVTDILNVYTISVGQSYQVRDTVVARVCRNDMPYVFRQNSYSQSGDYWLYASTVDGCDSSTTLLSLQVLEGQRDTVNLGLCYNQTSVWYDGIEFTQPGVSSITLGADTDGCPIVKTYVVTQYPLVVDTVYQTVCQNELPFRFMDSVIHAAGTYSIPHTMPSGCNDITVLVLSVNPFTALFDTVNASVCRVDLPYVFEGNTYDAAGTYSIQKYNSYGCDSLLRTLNLTVTEPQMDTVTVNICPESFPYVFDSLHTFNAPGTYFVNKEPDSLCSDYTMLVLSAHPAVRDTVTICTPDSSYTFGDTTFTVSTVYTYSQLNGNLCYDYHTLRVMLNVQPIYDTVHASICAMRRPYTFYDMDCYTTGLYTKTLTNRYGCDSAVVTLDLKVVSNPEYVITDHITRNDFPYVYGGVSCTKSGTYYQVLPAATETECDTIQLLNLTVDQVYTTTFDTTVCANTTVDFLGTQITTPGEHLFTYHLDGYDSVVVLNVHHNPTYVAETVYAEVGEFDLPYMFVDSAYYTAGYHEQTLHTVNGCDSVVSLFLTVHPAAVNNDTIQKEICSNELPLTLYDSVLTQAGVYRFLVHTSESYDSVFYVNLTVKESPTLVLPDVAYMCMGSTVTLTAQSTGGVYLWSNGSTESSITVSIVGQYSVTVSNAFGCSAADTVRVDPAVIPEAIIVGYDHVCYGSSLLLQAVGGAEFVWEDGSTENTRTVTPTENTTYSVTVTSSYGCSNSRSLTVTVNPLPEITLTGENSICEGASTTIIAFGAISYRWNTGSRVDRITVSTQGTYTVTATDGNSCTNTASVNVAVHALPNVKINGRTTFCQGGTTTITATGASTYEWSSGEVSQSVTASYAGPYTVTGTDQYGCSATKSVNVTQASVNASIPSGNRYFCHGQSTTLTVSGDASNTYVWFDGSTSDQVVVTSAGTYTVTVTNTAGCQKTLSAIVSEYAMTAPAISGNLTICEGTSTTLRATGGTSYEWDDGNMSAMITVNTTGTYTVTATNTYGCTATASASVLVNPAPAVYILTQNTICRGESVSLTAITSANSFNWNSGQNTATINVSPTLTSNYTVLVTDENGCTATATTQITVNQLPSAYVSGPTAICQGDTSVLTASGGVAYQWSTGQFDDHIDVTASGNYTVTVTGENGCSSSIQKTVTVNALPVATVTESVDICRGQQAQLITDAPAGCTYYWSTGSHQSRISVSEAGEYQVTITNSNLCSQVYHATVVVHELPQISIIGTSEICQGQSTALTVSSDGNNQYVWSNGDHNPSTTVSTAGQYYVTATNSYGCSSTASRGVVVHELPDPQISGNLTICKGKSTTLSASGGMTYLWNTGNTGANIAVAPSTSQSYTVTASNAYGCMASVSAMVTVNALPTVTFSGNTAICAGESTNITASGANTYAWSTGVQSATATFGNAGTYTVTATDAQNCSNSATVTITVNENPNVQIAGPDYICFGNVADLTVTGATTYTWSTEETASTISVSPAATSTYSVTGYDLNGCHTTTSKVVNVASLPVINVAGEKTICAGQSTTLTATGGASYQWSNGVTGNSITVAPAATQSYVVTVTDALGCSASKETQVTVNALPVVTFSGDTAMCAGNTVTLTAGGGTGYLWSTGANTAAITVNTAGYYKVTVSNADNCHYTDSIYVTVNPNPDVQFTSPQYICTGAVATLTASGASTYQWNTGETSSSISVSPTTTTTYLVTGYDAKGCFTTVSRVLNVEALPVISVAGPKTICAGQSTTLTASGGVSYLWENGETGSSITVTPAASQSYAVTVTNALGCSSSLVTDVVVNTLPNIVFSGNNTICAGQSTTLTATGASTYDWSNGSHTAAINVTEPGYYTVTATNAQNCSSVDSIYVTVNANPVVQISSSNYVCAGGIATLTASGANSYVWSTEEVSPTISVTPSTATTYSVTGYDTNGCSATVSRVMNVEALPVIQVLGTRTICAGQSTTLTATGGTSYSWSTGDSISSVVVTPETSQSYVVTATNAFGCMASTAVSITVNALPHLTFNGNTTICAGNTTTITAVGASSYLWSTGAQTGNVNISTTGTYYVTATNAQNCSKTDSIYVKVNPNPVVTVAGSNHVCSGSAVTLTASGANSYSWNTGETSAEISIAPVANTTYSVTGYDTNGCSTTVQKVVNVETPPVVQILGERVICQGQSTILTAIGGTSYQWSNGSNTQDIAVFPNISTSYTVTAYNDFGCATVATAVVTVNVLPSIIFSGSTSICQGQSTTISVTGGNSYVWSTGATGNSITVSEPGVYRVNATNSLNCVRTDSVNVVVWDNPTVSVEGASLICQGTAATLTASGAQSYVWSTGEGGTSIMVMPLESTSYSVIGYDEHGCATTVSKMVNVEDAPDVFISGNLSICHGESTTLTASDAVAYAWSTGATTPSITVSAQGAYTVTASSVNGCQGFASVTVVDNPVPYFTLNAVNSICENTTEVLSATGDNTYVWSTGDTAAQVTITTGGLYTVTATNSYGCQQVSSVYVPLLTAPTLDIVGVTDLCQDDSTMLVASSDAVEFLWSTGDTTQSVVVVPSNTTYSVTVTGANGCSSMAEHHITTLPTYNLTLTGTICEGQGYSQDGFDIAPVDTFGTFTYTRELQTVSGCDSIVNLLLTVNPLPRLDTINGNPHIIQHGNAYFSINNPLYVSSYEWRVTNTNWILSNSTFSNVTLNVTTNGYGTLIARGINNCGYRETSLELFCNVGIEDYETQAMVTLYPNPVHQSLFINIENAPEVETVRLYDETGRLVYQTRCDDTHLEIDCTRFANGHYTVQFLDEKGRKVESRKIIVNNK